MPPPIPGWTDRHSAVAACLALTAVTAAVASRHTPPSDVVVLVVVLVVALCSLAFDALAGVVIGLAGAAVVVAAQQALGRWQPADFALAALTCTALLTVGWLSGLTGRSLRGRGGNGPTAGIPAMAPAFGSLGLLTADDALVRLDDEMRRARRHDRPLAVAVVAVHITDAALDAAAATAAERAVARVVESLLRDSDVPFALSRDEFGAIMPETDLGTAWDVLGPVVDAAGRAAFTVRSQSDRHSVSECAELHAAILELSDEEDAGAFLTAARGQQGAPR